VSILAPIRWLWLKHVVVPAELAQARRAEAKMERLNAKLDEALDGCEDARLERKAIEADLKNLEGGSPEAEEYERLLRSVKVRQAKSEQARQILKGQVRLLEEYVALKEEIALVTLDDSDTMTARIDKLMVRLDEAREKRMRTEAAQEQLDEEQRLEAELEDYQPKYSRDVVREVDGPAPVAQRPPEKIEEEIAQKKEDVEGMSV